MPGCLGALGDPKGISTLLSRQLLTSPDGTERVLLMGTVNPMSGYGGLFLFDGYSVRRLDPIPTAGLALTDRHLVRVLCSEAVYEGSGDLLLYDERGVHRYFRVDDLTDAHDATWDGESIVCVSSTRNSIMWLSPYGELRRIWAPTDVEDCWHINSFVSHSAGRYCSAFGLFEKSREWEAHKQDHCGVIYDIDAGRVAVSGLDCPHNPLLLPEGWVVCNSGTGELLRIDPAKGQIVQRLQLQNWARGLAVSDDYYFVGESADRHKSMLFSSAQLCIVDRAKWEVCERIVLPVSEITSLALVPGRFLPALQRGFRTNVYRESDYTLYNLFHKTGTDTVFLPYVSEALPGSACKVRIEAQNPPPTMPAAAHAMIDVTIRNVGAGILASSPPNPVNLSYRWQPRDNSPMLEGVRTLLERQIPPGHSLSARMQVRAPVTPGSYQLRITLVQEWVAWFDDLDPANACLLDVIVGEMAPPPAAREGLLEKVSKRLRR